MEATPMGVQHPQPRVRTFIGIGRSTPSIRFREGAQQRGSILTGVVHAEAPWNGWVVVKVEDPEAATGGGCGREFAGNPERAVTRKFLLCTRCEGS